MEKNSTLPSNKLAEFLYEIENENCEHSEDLKESIRRIQREEIIQNGLLPEETMDDRAWGNTSRAERNEDGTFKRDSNGKVIYNIYPVTYTEKKAEWDHYKKCATEARRAKSIELKRRKLEIQKEALNSTFINIYAPFENEHKRLLIELLTEDYSRIMHKCEAFINKRIEKLLSPYIPQTLKVCKARFPDSMKENPGFMYIASKEYGEGKMIWVKPNLPYYFAQGTELQVLKENEADYLYTIDKSVVQFHNSRDMLAKRETQYAIKLKPIKTYFQLVQKNPLWYDKLAQELKRRAEQNA